MPSSTRSCWTSRAGGSRRTPKGAAPPSRRPCWSQSPCPWRWWRSSQPCSWSPACSPDGCCGCSPDGGSSGATEGVYADRATQVPCTVAARGTAVVTARPATGPRHLCEQPLGARTAGLSVEHHEGIPLVHGLALLAADLHHGARVLGLDRHLHLHRLEDRHRVALLDGVADGA